MMLERLLLGRYVVGFNVENRQREIILQADATEDVDQIPTYRAAFCQITDQQYAIVQRLGRCLRMDDKIQTTLLANCTDLSEQGDVHSATDDDHLHTTGRLSHVFTQLLGQVFQHMLLVNQVTAHGFVPSDIGQDNRVIFYPPYEEWTLATGVSVMLFDQLPIGVLAVLMGISCAVKHTAVKRLVYTKWYQQVMREHYWYWAVLVMALVAGGATYLIFHKFVGCPWSGYLALVDATLHVASGYYARRINLFELERRRYLKTIIVLRIAFALAYATYIWIALSLR